MNLAQRIGPKKIKAGAAAFVGLHVPLAALVAYAMMTDLRVMLPVLIVALLSTLVGVVGTIAVLFHILNTQDDAGMGEAGYQYS